jgi:hypothetical protein
MAFKHINPLNAELNPICHLLALLGAHHILHIRRIRVKQGMCVCVCLRARVHTHTQTHSTHMYFSTCTCESAFVLTIVLCLDMCNENLNLLFKVVQVRDTD